VKLLYFDCSAGVSGDMILGGLIDAGLRARDLKRELERLGTRGFSLAASRATRGGIRGTRVTVRAPGDPGHRHFRDFARILKKSRLSASVRGRSLALLKRIYEVEARVHGTTYDRVHLHELGSLDTLVDVVGVVLGLELLGIDRCESSAVNVGGGEIAIEHGVVSVPAPATAELLKGAPTFGEGSSFERTTPTGALLVSELAQRFGSWPAMTVRNVGYGLGSKDPKDGRPNALRIVIGESAKDAAQTVLVMEATIDDMSPELTGFLLERLLEGGALDVFVTPASMKKSRPGVNVTALAPPSRREAIAEIFFRESTTLGLRCHEVERTVLDRRAVVVKTRWGPVTVKVGSRSGEVLNVAPEFEDCRRIAEKHAVALKEVQHEAIASFRGKRNR